MLAPTNEDLFWMKYYQQVQYYELKTEHAPSYSSPQKSDA